MAATMPALDSEAPDFEAPDFEARGQSGEAVRLREEVDAVVESWADRNRGRDPGRRTYHVVQIVQPYPETAAQCLVVALAALASRP